MGYGDMKGGVRQMGGHFQGVIDFDSLSNIMYSILSASSRFKIFVWATNGWGVKIPICSKWGMTTRKFEDHCFKYMEM